MCVVVCMCVCVWSLTLQCIIVTAALYGVAVTEDDIIRVKAAGNANNDWKVVDDDDDVVVVVIVVVAAASQRSDHDCAGPGFGSVRYT